MAGPSFQPQMTYAKKAQAIPATKAERWVTNLVAKLKLPPLWSFIILIWFQFFPGPVAAGTTPPGLAAFCHLGTDDIKLVYVIENKKPCAHR